MLMRMFDTSDYERSLRRRRLMALGLMAVGITGLVCYALLIHDSDVLPDYARGFYLGAATGSTIGAVVLLARMQYLLTHPEARKKAKIQEQDEREKAIVNQAFQFAGMFTFFAAVASMFVLVAVSKTAALAVFQPVPVQKAVSARYLTLKITPELAGLEVNTLLRRTLGLSGTVLRRVKWLEDGITLDGVRVNVRVRAREGETLAGWFRRRVR